MKNEALFNKFYDYCKNENKHTKKEFEAEWQKMTDKTLDEAKETFNKVIQNEKLQNLLLQMTDEQVEATAKFLSQTLTYIILEKNTTGTTGVLEKLKEFRG